jgi:hypothetical protein
MSIASKIDAAGRHLEAVAKRADKLGGAALFEARASAEAAAALDRCQRALDRLRLRLAGELKLHGVDAPRPA